MRKFGYDFKMSFLIHLFDSIQRPNGADLSGMIIVDSTIFRALLEGCTVEHLEQIAIKYPRRPKSEKLEDVARWAIVYFHVFCRLNPNITTQADFGAAVGLSQGDVSALLSARNGFYFGEDRIAALAGKFSDFLREHMRPTG